MRPRVPRVPRPSLRQGRRGLLYLALLGGGLIWLYPFLWALGSSLKSTDGFFSGGLNPIPSEFHWSNYSEAWTQADFSRFFVNTVLFAMGTVIVTLLPPPWRATSWPAPTSPARRSGWAWSG
jgi:ABC-type glycerol-3-phosphate transport system permease component